MASLQQIAEFITDIESRGQRGIVQADFADALYSLANPAGVMQVSNPSGANVTGSNDWVRFDGWESSVDTKGVQDQLGSSEGSFLIKPNGGGDYLVWVFLRFILDSIGEVRLRPRHELAAGGSESFLIIDRDTFNASTPGCFLSVGPMLKKGFVENDKITTELYVDSGTVLTPRYGTFGVMRV